MTNSRTNNTHPPQLKKQQQQPQQYNKCEKYRGKILQY